MLSLVVAMGCTPQDVAVSSGRARFSDYPTDLFDAFRAACEGPGETYLEPGPGQVECREYLPPEATAAIILTYDGTTDDLPQMVIKFDARPEPPGYVVENDVFLIVPQKRGPDLLVRYPDARISRTLDRLYRRAGGIPE